jgi:pilus assembly protein FimV
LRASLASNDTFVRYGLDRPAYLFDFNFQVAKGTGGKDVLRVTSPRPVTEPFVTLLVEANWPRGRLLREYTVLLDPPVYAPGPAASEAPVAAPRATTAPAVSARPAPAAPLASAPAASEPRPSRAVAAPLSVEAGSTYRVRPNDTLWKIASAANPGPRSEVNRAMVAIYQANPQAFGGNINVLRAGSELAIPTSSEVAAISASAATAEVARQYQMWRDGSAAAAGPTADAGRLRLVTPEQGSATPSTATIPATPAAPAGGADIQARVQQLEAELAEARRLLEVRNAELATLQGGVPADAATPGEPLVAEPAPSDAVTPGTTEPVAEAPQAVVPEPAAEPEPTPAPPPAAEESPSLLDRLGQYWWVLLGLLAAALGIGALLRRRRESGAAEESLEEALGRRGSDDLRARPTMTARPRESDIVVEERQAAEPTVARAAAAVVAAPRAPEPSRKPVTIDDTLSGEGPASIEASDPLAEADFHMAYGLYDQAADLVQLAAKREPQRRDLKLKLLEIFFVWGNRDRFLEVARDLSATRAQAQPGEWDKILIMGKQMAADDPLFAGSVHGAGDSLDMELQRTHASIDMDLLGGEGPGPDLDLTATAPKVASEGGLDFILDEPVRGADEDDSALAPTLETQRFKPAASDEPTAEVAIEDLGLDVGDFEGLDDLEQQVDDLLTRPSAKVEDTIERPTLGRGPAEPEEDLLSSTSILRADAVELAEATREVEAGLGDLSDATSELPMMTSEQPTIEAPTIEAPTIEATAIDATGVLKAVDFPLDEESATMSEVGTKLDLARAYIDMGDPEGARSILDEVLQGGQRRRRSQEAERLIASLP